MAATYPADTFQEGVELTIEAANQLAQVVRGDANTEITVADGSTIPSIRKAQTDSMYFKEPEAWTSGQTETDYLQLKKYTNPTTGKESWWFAKGALVSNPIAMGTSPFGDDNWTLYTPEDLFISGKAEYESVYQALKGKAAEAGYNLVRGSFEEGGTLTETTDVLWYQANGKYYNWYNGSAKTVVAGSTPASTGGISPTAWVNRTGLTLRSEVDVFNSYIFNGDIHVQSVSGGSVVPSGFEYVNTSYGLLYAFDSDFKNNSHTVSSISQNSTGGYDIVTNVGTFEFVDLNTRQLRAANDISGYGADTTGATIQDDVIQKIANNSTVLNIAKGQSLRVSTIPTSFTLFTGGGRLIWDNDAASIIQYDMPDYFEINNFEIETIYRNRLAIAANYMKLNFIKEYQSDSRTEAARYNAVEWRSETEITSNMHFTYNTGARFYSIGDDCAISLSNIVCRVDHVGEGPDGNNNGTDGIKISGEPRSINISNYKCFGTSRDLIDTYIGGGECNISNVWGDGHYFNQIEIKSAGALASSNDDTPHDINISNVFCRPGGLGTSDIYAAIVLYNQNEGGNNTTTRRVNITNYNTRRVGLAAAGTYYGIRATAGFDININNVNMSELKDHGFNFTRCTNVHVNNSNFHGLIRAGSITDCNMISISNSRLGVDTQSGDTSTTGLVCVGTTEKLKVAMSDIIGSSRSLSVESSTVNKGKFVGCNLSGHVRLDVFTDFEFDNTNIDALSNPASSVDCILSAVDTPSAELKFIGGKLLNARRGINMQSISLLRCIGTTFENTLNPFGGTVTDNNRVIIGCISNGGGAFPAASGNDVIVNNIAI